MRTQIGCLIDGTFSPDKSVSMHQKKKSKNIVDFGVGWNAGMKY